MQFYEFLPSLSYMSSSPPLASSFFFLPLLHYYNFILGLFLQSVQSIMQYV